MGGPPFAWPRPGPFGCRRSSVFRMRRILGKRGRRPLIPHRPARGGVPAWGCGCGPHGWTPMVTPRSVPARERLPRRRPSDPARPLGAGRARKTWVRSGGTREKIGFSPHGYFQFLPLFQLFFFFFFFPFFFFPVEVRGGGRPRSATTPVRAEKGDHRLGRPWRAGGPARRVNAFERPGSPALLRRSLERGRGAHPTWCILGERADHARIRRNKRARRNRSKRPQSVSWWLRTVGGPPDWRCRGGGAGRNGKEPRFPALLKGTRKSGRSAPWPGWLAVAALVVPLALRATTVESTIPPGAIHE